MMGVGLFRASIQVGVRFTALAPRSESAVIASVRATGSSAMTARRARSRARASEASGLQLKDLHLDDYRI